MKTLLTAFYSFCALLVFAQANRTEGKIYQSDKKIIPAFFYLKSLEGTPQQFSYSLTAEEERNTLTADGAEKIELQDGTIYESYFISVPVLANDYLSRSKTDYEADVNNFQGQAFVERIMDGSISFYQFVDRYGFSHFFYRLAADTSVTLLRNKTYVLEGGRVEYDMAYKNQLSFLASKYCPVAPPEIDRLAYDLKPMINVITALNTCAGSAGNATAYLKKKKATTNIGIMGGVLSSALGLNSYPRSVSP
ncbi:MAG TPA: hypothetical protein VFT06_02210, partial [Flavisolibacter sp.]|nr:hypothetical protein [Flavisolibacter sp.]